MESLASVLCSAFVAAESTRAEIAVVIDAGLIRDSENPQTGSDFHDRQLRRQSLDSRSMLANLATLSAWPTLDNMIRGVVTVVPESLAEPVPA